MYIQATMEYWFCENIAFVKVGPGTLKILQMSQS